MAKKKHAVKSKNQNDSVFLLFFECKATQLYTIYYSRNLLKFQGF